MKRSVALATAAGLAVAVLPVAAFAQPASAHKPAPAHTPALAASQDKACTLSPSLDYSGGDEASCIAVGATLSAVPEVGHTAQLHITVKAARAERHTVVAVSLPRTFAFAGASAATVTHRAFTGAGAVNRANVATFDLKAGQTRTLTRTVKAVAPGFGAISVTAQNRLSAKRTDGGTSSVFATTGRSAAATFRGGSRAQTAAVTQPTAHTASPSAGPERPYTSPFRTAPVTVAGIARPHAIRPDTAGTSCATGTWNYVDQTNTTRPAANTLVEVFNSANTMLTYAVSGGDGSYNACWATGGNTTSVYVKFVESNNIWQLVDDNNTLFNFSTGIVAVADGTSHSFGNLQPGVAADNPGLHAFSIANDEWQWVHQYFSNQCWSPYETSCLQLKIHWQSDSTTGTFWNTSGVYLLAGSPDTVDEPAHEYRAQPDVRASTARTSRARPTAARTSCSRSARRRAASPRVGPTG